MRLILPQWLLHLPPGPGLLHQSRILSGLLFLNFQLTDIPNRFHQPLTLSKLTITPSPFLPIHTFKQILQLNIRLFNIEEEFLELLVELVEVGFDGFSDEVVVHVVDGLGEVDVARHLLTGAETGLAVSQSTGALRHIDLLDDGYTLLIRHHHIPSRELVHI